MNKKLRFTVLVAILFAAHGVFAGPSEGSTYQSIDATTAQSYINNYKNNVSNKFCEFYALDLNAISTMVANGAANIRVYNGIGTDGSKLAIMVPTDASYANMTGGSQMAVLSAVWICPPNCDVTRSASAQMTPKATAQAAANSYYNNNSYESYNAFLLYPPAIVSLKTWGATYIQVCNALDGSGNRCMIYRGVSASGIASYYIQGPGSMGNHVTM
ncbi:MAG: hypothetical protein JSS82_19585 [Bacteroidetes bacterium]|nr:hypothetical protein [Bacteroidota bacterium]